MSYFIRLSTHFKFDDAIDRVTRALQTEGFGILTDIDVKATLKEKLDVNFKKYRILGACNPSFAYKAFQVEDQIGIMMPCNVTVIEQDNGHVDISIMDPTAAFNVIENEALQPFARELKSRLERCLTYLEE
ncbi:DUF302 domain-containing protein [Labilibaculum sp. A4]|uniref:DUF302 domain-containing protein n=1 Tax=Labilibaculum euxinus TaxID=2686357 RepID=A0A425YBM2_9BACT|nr:DUF302 domain-containing protein [Labilibaculum euxinus]MDQ1771509.1 DUF302 domain-containing protein [Labilibaculum euxinus]MUP39133.1 DUF302 domain-containing protein [Labilibaculum euxinus]MVB08338.1 DUF302 domain-containing protein [Labilibaculum euxinus]MWN76603.1 DUF302 domain-containing protein [Labilibaculum euxinus]